MMKRLISPFVVLPICILMVPGASRAACPPTAAATLVGWGSAPAVPAVSVFTIPNGTGDPLSSCYGPGGVAVNAWIDVWVSDGTPCIGWSQQNVQLNMTSMTWCPAWMYPAPPPPQHRPNFADNDSAAPGGHMQFTAAYHGGGCTWTTQVWLWDAVGLLWVPIGPVLPIHFNSADMNANLVVDIADLASFAATYAGPYSYCADFVWDGVVNLSDLVKFAQAWRAACP
jgi:hypothetical protein